MPMVKTQTYEQDKLVDVREAARLLGVSPRTVNGLLARGVLERVKIGRSTRVRLSDVQRVIERGAA